MKSRLAACVAALALLTSACGTGSVSDSSGPGRPAPKPLEATNVEMVKPAADVDSAPLARGVRGLGYSLGGKLAAADADGNLVFSPVSLAIAFAMLREGARGSTGATIDETLRLPANRQVAYNALVTALADPGPGNVLDIGNGIFVKRAYPIEPSYLTALKKWYDTGVYQTDFPSPGIGDINSYVAANTRGRIPHFLDELPADEAMMLVNTVYLNARWQSPFDTSSTEDMPFRTVSGPVTVKMMRRTGPMDYAHGPGWQAVRLAYRGDRLSMWVLLPTNDGRPMDLLSPRMLDAAAEGFASTDVDMRLPRWNIDNKFDLSQFLKALGLSGVLDGAGDFRGITSDARFEVTQVIQQANITVGEKGTVAAAATGIGAEVGAAPAGPTLFDADHPFAFAIMDNTTGTPLFEGTVSDPS